VFSPSSGILTSTFPSLIFRRRQIRLAAVTFVVAPPLSTTLFLLSCIMFRWFGYIEFFLAYRWLLLVLVASIYDCIFCFVVVVVFGSNIKRISSSELAFAISNRMAPNTAFKASNVSQQSAHGFELNTHNVVCHHSF